MLACHLTGPMVFLLVVHPDQIPGMPIGPGISGITEHASKKYPRTAIRPIRKTRSAHWNNDFNLAII